MGIGDAARSSGDVMFRLQELERQIRDLQTARRLESASIGAGGLRIQGGRLLAEDSAGADIFEVTTEPPSIFMEQSLISTLAREIIAETVHADTVPTTQALNATQGNTTGFVDLTTSGPSVTFETVTGRWIVMLFARFHVESNVGNYGAVASYDVTGAQSITASVNRDVGRSASSLFNLSSPGFGVQSLAYSGVHTGSPGQITATMKYELDATIATADVSASFSNRSLIVIAF